MSFIGMATDSHGFISPRRTQRTQRETTMEPQISQITQIFNRQGRQEILTTENTEGVDKSRVLHRFQRFTLADGFSFRRYHR